MHERGVNWWELLHCEWIHKICSDDTGSKSNSRCKLNEMLGVIQVENLIQCPVCHLSSDKLRIWLFLHPKAKNTPTIQLYIHLIPYILGAFCLYFSPHLRHPFLASDCLILDHVVWVTSIKKHYCLTAKLHRQSSLFHVKGQQIKYSLKAQILPLITTIPKKHMECVKCQRTEDGDFRIS